MGRAGFSASLSRLILAGGLLVLGTEAASGGDSVCDIRGVPRVVAVGDVHGSHDQFVQVLKMARVVDAALRWSAGKAHLVQVGDVPDRGPDSRKVMDLLMRLEGEARKAGGRVHALLGNHEVMNLLGDLRYVTPGEYEAFRTPESERLRERAYKDALRGARENAKAAKTPLDETAFREQFLKDVPLGFIEHRRAFGPEGEYGRWLRGHDAVVKIDGVSFVHGGISPAVAPLGCEAINATVRQEINEGFENTRAAPLQSLAAREDGPLWYRGLAREDEAAFKPALDKILAAMGTHAIVIGHTVTEDGRIRPRFGGAVVMIDAGMLPAFGGKLAALEIGPDGMVADYPSGREPLFQKAARRLLDRPRPVQAAP